MAMGGLGVLGASLLMLMKNPERGQFDVKDSKSGEGTSGKVEASPPPKIEPTKKPKGMKQFLSQM